jgi:hypothetical protein
MCRFPWLRDPTAAVWPSDLARPDDDREHTQPPDAAAVLPPGRHDQAVQVTAGIT